MKAEKNPGKKFKMLLVILAAILLFIVVLLASAFKMLQWAQEYGLIDAPAEAVSINGLNDIDMGAMEMFSGGDYQPVSAIESIQMEYFMEES